MGDCQDDYWKDESKPREQNPWYRELLEGGRAEKGPAQ